MDLKYVVQNWFFQKSSFGIQVMYLMYFISTAAAKVVVKVVLQAIRQGELQKCQNWPLQSKAKPEDAFLLAEVMETIKMAIAIQES